MQCIYPSQIHNGTYFVWENSVQGRCAQEWAKWNGMSSPFYPAGVEWNGNPFHFAPQGQFGMWGKMEMEKFTSCELTDDEICHLGEGFFLADLNQLEV